MKTPVKKISEVLSKDVFERAKQIVDECLKEKEGDYDSTFFRYGIHNHSFFKALHHSVMLDLARELFGDVKPSYCFLSMYQHEKSICPPHVDRPQCKFTIDVCLSQGEPWEIFVNKVPYLLDENEALVYSGTDHPHFRKKIKQGNFCNLIFFHFVPSDFMGELK